MEKKKSLINDENRKWWTLATVCFGLLMIVLDGNVVNLAVPQILKDFGASLSQVEWINNAYLLTFAILLITFGRLGDELGRKKMFIAGLVTFILGSLLCATASNIDYLIGYRILQGLGGAAMMPATLSLIAANFEKKERGTAMGLWGAVSGLAIVLGPIIGGYLTEKGLGVTINEWLHISEYWRYVFYINLPIGIIALLATIFIVRESKDNKTKHHYDILGIVLSSISIFTLTFAFIEGAKYGWWNVVEVFSLFGYEISFGSLSVIPILFAISAIFIGLFIWHEKNSKKDPLVDLKLFLSKNFSVGSLGAMILSFAMMGAFFLLPLFLQSVMGFSSIQTGINLIPFAITILIMSPLAGKLADKFGGKYLIVAGMLIMSVGIWLLGHFQITTQTKDLIWPFIVTGIGMGLAMSPLTNITLLDINENEIGGASGVLSTTRQIGSVMGIAILGAFLQTTVTANLETNIKKIDSLSEKAQVIVLDEVKSVGFSGDKEKMQEDLKNKLTDVYKEEMTQSMPQMPNIDEIKAQIAQLPAMAQQQAMVELENKMQDANKQIEAKKQEMIEKMKNTGDEIANASKQSMVDAINKTFKVAALFSLFGALISLMFTEKKK